MAQLINEAKRFQKLAGLLKENQTLYHRGREGSQELIVPNDLGQDIDSDDFYTALEASIDGEMSGMDYRVGEEYRLFVVDQDGDDPTKTVYFGFKQNGNKLEVDPSSIKIETDESLLNEAKDISQEIQALVDKNEFLKGKVKATPSDIIEGSKFVLLFSEDAAKHIAERHLDGTKPGSLFKSGVNLRDVAKKLLNIAPSEEAGGRVKWLGANGGGVGEMGVAKSSPEEVAKMKDYTMPDGQKEQVKIAPGKRKPTSEVSLITAELGTLGDGRKALSMITMFPGGTKVDGTEIPMNRGEFAAKGLYFIVDPSSSLLKENIIKVVNEALAKFRKTLNEDNSDTLSDYFYGNDLKQYTGVTSFEICDEDDWDKVKDYIEKDKSDFLQQHPEVTEQEFDNYMENWIDNIEDARGYESRNQQDMNMDW